MKKIRHAARSSPVGLQPGQAGLLLYGDSLDSLTRLAVPAPDDHGALDDRRARTMIVGVRVPDTNHPRQALRSQLRAAHDILAKPLRTHLSTTLQREGNATGENETTSLSFA